MPANPFFQSSVQPLILSNTGLLARVARAATMHRKGMARLDGYQLPGRPARGTVLTGVKVARCSGAYIRPAESAGAGHVATSGAENNGTRFHTARYAGPKSVTRRTARSSGGTFLLPGRLEPGLRRPDHALQPGPPGI